MESSSALPTHTLVPGHSIASEQEVSQLLETLHCTIEQFPVITIADPAIASLGARPGDVIKIQRISPVTNTVMPYYRVVVETDV